MNPATASRISCTPRAAAAGLPLPDHSNTGATQRSSSGTGSALEPRRNPCTWITGAATAGAWRFASVLKYAHAIGRGVAAAAVPASGSERRADLDKQGQVHIEIKQAVARPLTSPSTNAGPLHALFSHPAPLLGIVASYMPADQMYQVALTLLAIQPATPGARGDRARLNAVLAEAVQHHGLSIKSIPASLQTPTIALNAVRSNAQAYWRLGEQFRSHDVSRRETKHDQQVNAQQTTEDVAQDHHNQALRLLAVENAGLALSLVPRSLRTPALCELAVRQTGNAIHFVPENLRTPQMYALALASCPQVTYSVPAEMRTELCARALKSDALARALVTQKWAPAELYAAAVKWHGAALADVPRAQRTETLCQTALEQSGAALSFVPSQYLTEAMCRSAVAKYPRALTAVPARWRDRTMCETAVAKDGALLRAVPPRLIDEALCRLAVSSDASAIMHVPGQFLTEEFYHFAVQQSPEVILYVPGRHIDRAMLRSALNFSLMLRPGMTLGLNHVPKQVWDGELAMLYAQSCAGGFTEVAIPYRLKTPAFYLSAVYADSTRLVDVPMARRDMQTCLPAVRYGSELLEFVPSALRDEFLARQKAYDEGDYVGFMPQ